MDANSQPITPPPMTTRRGGTWSISSRPVESTQRGWSMPSIGGRSGREPEAMTACLKVTDSPPSTSSTLALANRPRPSITVMPLAFSSPPRPETDPSTTCCLLACICGQSISTPDTLTPSWANVVCASLTACALCTRAFVGMQPTFRQVPPRRPCSMTATDRPSWLARIAAGYPPGPPPRTATSTSMRKGAPWVMLRPGKRAAGSLPRVAHPASRPAGYNRVHADAG